MRNCLIFIIKNGKTIDVKFDDNNKNNNNNKKNKIHNPNIQLSTMNHHKKEFDVCGDAVDLPENPLKFRKLNHGSRRSRRPSSGSATSSFHNGFDDDMSIAFVSLSSPFGTMN